jgi:putative ABC transport system substrate-binding protein
MRRRDFIALSSAAIVAGDARAQNRSRPRIGFLSLLGPNSAPFQTAAFIKGLSETGQEVGQHAEIEYRWGEERVDRMPALAAELVKANVSVIAAFSTVAARAAQSATRTVPIVFLTGDDPIRAGFVESLNRPKANLTGVSFTSSVLGAKRLELARTLVSKTSLIAVLNDPNSPESTTMLHDLQEAADGLKQRLHVLNVKASADFEPMFASIVQQQANLVVVCGSPFFNAERGRIAGLAARHKLPSVFSNRNYVEAGGLISYGASVPDAYRQAGVYTGRILKGERSADLPILQPTKFDLVLNLKTAKAIGLQISDKMMALSDEVIE